MATSYIGQNQRVSLYKEGKVSGPSPGTCFLNRSQPRLQDVDVALALPTMAFQLTIPSGQLVVISAPTVLRIVWPARVTVYLTCPVCPLKGTERWLIPGTEAVRVVGVLPPIWTVTVEGALTRTSMKIESWEASCGGAGVWP